MRFVGSTPPPVLLATYATAASSVSRGRVENTVNALEQALLPGPFILGERFGAADVYVASEIVWGLLTKSLEPREIFQKYTARCAERPAFKRAAAQDEKYMQELQTA